jgi:type III pantothenate kinase
VNPAALQPIRAAFRALRVVGEDVPLPLPVRYRPPLACGPDRVLAVAGALHRRPEAAGVLVLDLGTCLTATVGVRGAGVLGGAILPGFDLMAASLERGTAGLPRVPWGPPPDRALGDSTEDAIRSGIWAALAGAGRELVRRCRAEAGVDLDVVAAGSGAGALASVVPEVQAVHPFATLWGVYLACGGPSR